MNLSDKDLLELSNLAQGAAQEAAELVARPDYENHPGIRNVFLEREQYFKELDRRLMGEYLDRHGNDALFAR